MAQKKSQNYWSLWANCDELRGGMDGMSGLMVTLWADPARVAAARDQGVYWAD